MRRATAAATTVLFPSSTPVPRDEAVPRRRARPAPASHAPSRVSFGTVLTPLPLAITWLGAPIDFVSGYLVFFEGMAGAVVITARLCSEARLARGRYLVQAAILVVLSFALCVIASAVYYVPPVRHANPLPPGTANSFPSHHAWLGAAVVALVFLIAPRASIPFGMLTVAIDVVLVLNGDHHLVDVLGSSIAVLAATALAMWAAPVASRLAAGAIAGHRRREPAGRAVPEHDPRSEGG
jgi:hypothetical protein